MRYSVYNYGRRAYDYYEAPEASGTHVGSPPAPMGVGDLGAPPGRASWRLPGGARKVGSGEFPQGKIASVGGLGDVDDMLSSPTTMIACAALAYLAWRLFR